MPDLSPLFGRLMKSHKLWQLVLAVYWLALFVATHLPKESPIVPTDQRDKLMHFTAFALLALLLATTWQLAAGYLTIHHLRWAWIVLVLYAALDEWTQSFVGRETSFYDWLADAAGAAAGLALFVWVRNQNWGRIPRKR